MKNSSITDSCGLYLPYYSTALDDWYSVWEASHFIPQALICTSLSLYTFIYSTDLSRFLINSLTSFDDRYTCPELY